MILPEVIYSTVANKCPRCHTGRVFTNNNPYSFKNGLQMERYCGHCGELYDKEPGYFYGAMFVSYAMTAGWFIFCYALNSFLIQMGNLPFLILFGLSVLGLSPLTFRWSRSLWINLFVRFDKSKKEKVYKGELPEGVK